MSGRMAAAVLLVFLGWGRAQVKAPDSLTVFKPGDTARAAAVNANFKVLWDRLNKLAAENANLAEKLDTLQKALPAGGADPEFRLPIGTIVASMLPPTEFDPTRTWLPADGSLAPATYVTAFKTERLPDLRGVFLRGLNQARNDEYSDPGGASRTAGSLQGDATRLPDSAFAIGSGGGHTHPLDFEVKATRNYGIPDAPFMANTVASPWLDTNPRPATLSAGAHTHGISGGDRETRPKNVAVYYYIKVK